MNKLKTAIGVMRPPFLVLGPACTFLGMCIVLHDIGQVNAWQAVLAFIGAVAAHACVNAMNEYDDIKTGLDLKTTSTPFSGGSGTLRQNPADAPVALWVGIISALIDLAIGVYFFTHRGWPMAVIGIVGLCLIFTYTPLLNKSPLLCLLAPGLGFGTLMVLGTELALSGTISATGVLASMVPFFLVSNLLLLNQFPDVEADRTVGRRHFPILIGRKASAVIYVVFLAAAYVCIVIGVDLRLFPIWSLLGLITLVFAVPAGRGALTHADGSPSLLPAMGMNVLVNVVTPILTGIGFLIK